VTHVSGPFEVKVTPLAWGGSGAPDGLGRMSIEKSFHGDLEAVSVGEMLTAISATEGSAGYVAVERVSGSLSGRTGTFLLQHSGSMSRGQQSLSITVVPDSGTGDLAGLRGQLRIEIVEGRHSYLFDYEIGPAPAA
jgi:hypothetical protein